MPSGSTVNGGLIQPVLRKVGRWLQPSLRHLPSLMYSVLESPWCLRNALEPKPSIANVLCLTRGLGGAYLRTVLQLTVVSVRRKVARRHETEILNCVPRKAVRTSGIRNTLKAQRLEDRRSDLPAGRKARRRMPTEPYLQDAEFD